MLSVFFKSVSDSRAASSETAKAPGLPYHRVVAAGGRVGGYGSSPELKKALLRAEGLVIVGSRIRGFPRHRLRGNAFHP